MRSLFAALLAVLSGCGVGVGSPESQSSGLVVSTGIAPGIYTGQVTCEVTGRDEVGVLPEETVDSLITVTSVTRACLSKKGKKSGTGIDRVSNC